jgi:hypothetical protein
MGYTPLSTFQLGGKREQEERGPEKLHFGQEDRSLGVQLAQEGE